MDAGIYTQGYHRVYATVTARDNATVEARGSSYVEDYTGGVRPASGRAIVKDFFGDMIYVRKGVFKIIETD